MTAQLTLDLGLVFAGEHRIVTTCEPVPRPAPSFILVRNAASRAWPVGVNVEPGVAEVLDALASDESPAADPTLPPRHEARYRELLGRAHNTGEEASVEGITGRWVPITSARWSKQTFR